MKYEAINDRVIAAKRKEAKTESGIILSESEHGASVELEVIATTENTRALQGKLIAVEQRRFREYTLPDGLSVSVKVDDILAVRDGSPDKVS